MKHSKPEKKELNSLITKTGFSFLPGHALSRREGHNRAIDEYEKFLPSEKEIIGVLESAISVEFVRAFPGRYPGFRNLSSDEIICLAKAISKRLGVGNEQS